MLFVECLTLMLVSPHYSQTQEQVCPRALGGCCVSYEVIYARSCCGTAPSYCLSYVKRSWRIVKIEQLVRNQHHRVTRYLALQDLGMEDYLMVLARI